MGSSSHGVYGLVQQHIVNCFYAVHMIIGQLEHGPGVHSVLAPMFHRHVSKICRHGRLQHGWHRVGAHSVTDQFSFHRDLCFVKTFNSNDFSVGMFSEALKQSSVLILTWVSIIMNTFKFQVPFHIDF